MPHSARHRRWIGVLLLIASGALPQRAAAEELHHVITYGQSVAIGMMAVPALSTAPRAGQWMFKAGVRAHMGPGTPAENRASLVPLAEQNFWWLGETPTAGTLDMIVQQSPPPAGVEYLGSAPGKGGQMIHQLSWGAAPFNNLIWDVVYGQANARALGHDYRLKAFTWGQGASDQYWGTDPATYTRAMETLRLQVEWVNRVVTGRDERIPMIAYQSSSHIAVGSATPTIALAQAEAARAHPQIHLATALYMMDYADALHLDARSVRWLGAYYGRVYQKVVVEGLAWKPLQPTSAMARGRVLRANFEVPSPPLVLDTQWVSNPGQYGFSLVDADGLDNPLTGVALDRGGAAVWISAQRDIAPGSKLRYGWNGSAQGGRKTGPRGNLRDSAGAALVFDPQGIAAPMHNWCLLFEIPVSVS